jgi:hypothetical protein
MAVVRARTSPPYALIIFVITTVIFAALWVIALTQSGELSKRAEKAETAAKPYISEPEKKLGDLVRDTAKAPTNRPTAFATAMAQRTAVVRTITGKDDDSAGAADLAVAQGDAAIADIKKFMDDLKLVPTTKPVGSDSLLSSLAMLKGVLAGEAIRNKQLEGAVDAGKAELAERRKQLENEAAEFKKNNEDLTARINALEADKAALAAKLPATEKELQQANTKLVEGYDSQIRTLNLQIAQNKLDLGKAQSEVERLNAIVGLGRTDQSKSFAAEASGKVIRTNLVLGELSINVGKADRVTRGLTFVVFDSRSGVRTDPGLDMGKASIEVMEVGEHESRCRVTRTARNQRLEIGDVIYNLVYSQQKSLKFHFAVYGDFDLDGDGDATSAERTRVIHMIEEWGGQVVELKSEELRDKTGQVMLDKDGKPIKHPMVTPDTDFLILGLEPADPRDVNNLDLVSSEQIDALRGKREEWAWVQGDGKRSGVSVLNMNRFLHLIGYFNTTIVR